MSNAATKTINFRFGLPSILILGPLEPEAIMSRNGLDMTR